MHETDAIAARVAGLCRERGCGSILDHGCGSGELLDRLRALLDDSFELYGVDYLARMCSRHRPADHDGIRFVDRDSGGFDDLLSEHRFGMVLSCFALHHYRHPVAELRALERLLEPGGRLFLIDWRPGPDTPAGVVKDIFGLLDEARAAFAGQYHRHHYRLDEALDLFAATGLGVLEANEARFESTDEDCRRVGGEKLEDIRHRLEALDSEELPAVWKEHYRRVLELIAGLVEECGFDYSTHFTVIAEKPAG